MKNVISKKYSFAKNENDEIKKFNIIDRFLQQIKYSKNIHLSPEL